MHAFKEFIVGDWWIAIPMFAMSFTGIFLVIWRILLNNNGNTQMNVFLPEFQAKLEKEGVDGALKFCRERTDIIPSRLFTAGMDVSKQGMAAMRRSMANVVELEITPDLNYLLPPILGIAKIATMVGLFGTVISMIGTFEAISKSKGGASEQGEKIGLALFATAVGLVTAIPLVFAHVMFKAWIANFEVRMKSAAQKLMVLVQAAKTPAKAPAKPAAAPAAAAAGGTGITRQ